MDKKSKGKKLLGPYKGTVSGVTNNEATIEDRLEGKDHRNSIDFTGCLIIVPDNAPASHEDFAYITHCTKESEAVGED